VLADVADAVMADVADAVAAVEIVVAEAVTGALGTEIEPREAVVAKALLLKITVTAPMLADLMIG